MNYLQRWLDLCNRFSAIKEEKFEMRLAYTDLERRYSEPHRYYHTMNHIGHCLYELDAYRGAAIAQTEVELAIWYHDAIYDIQAKDNEEKSAVLFLNTALRFPQDVLNCVRQLILITKHIVPPFSTNEKVLVDIDLSILGQSVGVFDEYEAQIRTEYMIVPKDIFNARRASILKSILTRPTIYSTDHFRDKYEVQARLNLVRSLKKLEG